MNLPICRTCKYWDQHYPENQNIGVCVRMGVIVWPTNNEASISLTYVFSKPTSDFQAIRTRDTFGCRFHSDYPNNEMQSA